MWQRNVPRQSGVPQHQIEMNEANYHDHAWQRILQKRPPAYGIAFLLGNGGAHGGGVIAGCRVVAYRS